MNSAAAAWGEYNRIVKSFNRRTALAYHEANHRFPRKNLSEIPYGRALYSRLTPDEKSLIDNASRESGTYSRIIQDNPETREKLEGEGMVLSYTVPKVPGLDATLQKTLDGAANIWINFGITTDSFYRKTALAFHEIIVRFPDTDPNNLPPHTLFDDLQTDEQENVRKALIARQRFNEIAKNPGIQEALHADGIGVDYSIPSPRVEDAAHLVKITEATGAWIRFGELTDSLDRKTALALQDVLTKHPKAGPDNIPASSPYHKLNAKQQGLVRDALALHHEYNDIADSDPRIKAILEDQGTTFKVGIPVAKSFLEGKLPSRKTAIRAAFGLAALAVIYKTYKYIKSIPQPAVDASYYTTWGDTGAVLLIGGAITAKLFAFAKQGNKKYWVPAATAATTVLTAVASKFYVIPPETITSLLLMHPLTTAGSAVAFVKGLEVIETRKLLSGPALAAVISLSVGIGGDAILKSTYQKTADVIRNWDDQKTGEKGKKQRFTKPAKIIDPLLCENPQIVGTDIEVRKKRAMDSDVIRILQEGDKVVWLDVMRETANAKTQNPQKIYMGADKDGKNPVGYVARANLHCPNR